MSDTRPDWMVEDHGGEYCSEDVALDPADAVADDDVDELVLTAGLGPDADEAQKRLRMTEYAMLFPDKAR